jgi:HSP20 family protein
METRPVRQTDGVERAYLSPRVDIIETKDSYVLEAEMPGVTKDGLEILLENNELTIIGRRPGEQLEAELVYRESTPRDFRRVFVLDPTIDTGKIEAKLEDGVLNLKLPKAEQLTPRRIKVSD